MVGYNEKYPSGFRKVARSPPFNMTLGFVIFIGRPIPFAATPVQHIHKSPKIIRNNETEKDSMIMLIEWISRN